MPTPTRGAIVRTTPGTYEVVDLVADDPRQDELTVRMVATGMCHSDDHVATGDVPVGTYPMCGGHEGGGVVEQVGPNTRGFAEGDHVVFSFLPACGQCRWCASGLSNLCDLGEHTLAGGRFDDPTSYRMHLTDGTPVGQLCGISTFAEHTTVSVASAVRIDPDIPLEKACLVGCGVATGWGSAVNSGEVAPGDTVLVMGIGGIGANAVQGARHAGATHVVAVDPVAFKQDKARELGATHACAGMEEATDLVRSLTRGQGADVSIVTVGVVDGDHVAQAFEATRKAGTCVVTGLGDITKAGVPIPLGELTLFQKRLQGSLFGASNPKTDITRLLGMYTAGQLELDALVTNTYSLDQVAQGYEDMHAGKNIRGVIVF